MRLALLLLALVAAVSASTPPGFKPQNSDSLTAAFGTTKATDGRNIPMAGTASPPQIFTSSQISGQYILMMVDPDATGGFLHWLQDVTPSHSKSSNGYQLTANTSARADYRQPSPPFKVPFTHRYVLLLLNATDITGIGDEALSAAAATRNPWDTASVVNTTGVPIIGSTWFNVTNEQSLTTSTSASGTGYATGTAGTVSPPSSTSSPIATTNGAAVVGWDAALGLSCAVAFAGLL